MRKVLNDNPVAQMAVLGLLAVIVAFLLLTRAALDELRQKATPAAQA